MDASGGGLTNLTNDADWDVSPAWSPDGEQIAFASDRDGNWEIYVLDVGGGGATRLTNEPAEDAHPTWAPHGNRIAFASTRAEPDPGGCSANCNHEIYVMRADGSRLTRLTDDPAHDWDPAWTPR
jgi:TolB protein